MKRTNVPEAVQPSFNEVNQAVQEKEKMIYQAREEYNKRIPQARGSAEKTIREAEGYALQRVNRAQGRCCRDSCRSTRSMRRRKMSRGGACILRRFGRSCPRWETNTSWMRTRRIFFPSSTSWDRKEGSNEI